MAVNGYWTDSAAVINYTGTDIMNAPDVRARSYYPASHTRNNLFGTNMADFMYAPGDGGLVHRVLVNRIGTLEQVVDMAVEYKALKNHKNPQVREQFSRLQVLAALSE